MNIVLQGITSSQLCINQLKPKKKKVDVELSIFLMGFGKERGGVSTSDAHLGDVVICAALSTSADIDSADPKPISTQTNIFVCLAGRKEGRNPNPSPVFHFLVKVPTFYCGVLKRSTSAQPLIFVLPTF